MLAEAKATLEGVKRAPLVACGERSGGRWLTVVSWLASKPMGLWVPEVPFGWMVTFLPTVFQRFLDVLGIFMGVAGF